MQQKRVVSTQKCSFFVPAYKLLLSEEITNDDSRMPYIRFNDIEKAVNDAEKRWIPQSANGQLKNKKVHLRGPIYGYHALSDIDFAFLDLPLLQRLRYIAHFGFVDKIYPRADRTRFEHSID